MYFSLQIIAVHSTTGATPADMYTGTDLRLPLDLMRGCPPEAEESSNYGSYVQKLTVKKINDVVFCIQKTPKDKKISFILMRYRENARAGTEGQYHGVPTPHLYPRITGKTLYTDNDMMIPKKDDSTF